MDRSLCRCVSRRTGLHQAPAGSHRRRSPAGAGGFRGRGKRPAMSGMDEDDKGFLARWSQRKREAKQQDQEIPAAEADIRSGPAGESEAEPEFDLASLPKLDDLTATTDITAFLRKG